MEDTKINIYQALFKAQQDMGPVLKNATNPAFRSKYADLGAVIETITEPLHNAGIVFTQPLVIVEGVQYIQTVLTHVESDTKVDSFFKVVSKDMDDPQKVGAAITYGRRYSLLSFLGLAPEDDDGNLSSQSSKGDPSPSQAHTKPATQPAKTATPAPGDGGDNDVNCEIPSCKNTIWASKVEASKKYNKGHVICYTHSTNGDWERLLAEETGYEPTAYDMARE